LIKENMTVTRWIVTPQLNNSVIETTVWVKDKDRVSMSQVFGFGIWERFRDHKPTVDLDNAGGFDVSQDSEWDLVTLSHAGDTVWNWPETMSITEQTEFETLVAEQGSESVEQLGWELWEVNCVLTGPLELKSC
jgi:hypothetical protein